MSIQYMDVRIFTINGVRAQGFVHTSRLMMRNSYGVGKKQNYKATNILSSKSTLITITMTHNYITKKNALLI